MLYEEQINSNYIISNSKTTGFRKQKSQSNISENKCRRLKLGIPMEQKASIISTASTFSHIKTELRSSLIKMTFINNIDNYSMSKILFAKQ